MKTSRLVSGVAAGAAIALSLTACVGDQAAVENDDDSTTNEGAAADDVRLAFIHDPEHPYETCGVQAMNESLEGSGLSVTSYPAGQLGNEEELVEQVQSGALDLAIASPAVLGMWEESTALFEAAYLFSDVDHFEETLNGDVAGEVWDELRESSGLDVLSTWYYGTRQLTSQVEVNTSDDLAGQILRAPDAPLYQVNARILGGSPTAMALGEVYLSLQQGAVDAQENPIPTIASQNFHEVQNYINLTNHVIAGLMVVRNEDTLAALPEDQEQALRDATQDAAGAVRECVEDMEASYLEEWEESGVIEINDNVDIEHFRDRAAEIIPNEFPWGDKYLEIQEG